MTDDHESKELTISQRAMSAANQAMAQLMDDYEVEQAVTRPVLKQYAYQPFAVLFETAAYEAPRIGDAPMKYKNPPRICEVLVLPRREPMVLVMNMVLEAELDRAFPNGSYKGGAFAILPLPANNPEKNYRVYSIQKLRQKGAAVIPEAEGERIDPGKKKASQK